MRADVQNEYPIGFVRPVLRRCLRVHASFQGARRHPRDLDYEPLSIDTWDATPHRRSSGDRHRRPVQTVGRRSRDGAPRRASGVLGMRHHSPIRASVCQTRYRNHAQTGLPADLRRAFDIRCVKLTSGAWRQFRLAKTSLLTSSPCPPLSCHSHCRNSRHRQLDLSHPMVRGRGGQQ